MGWRTDWLYRKVFSLIEAVWRQAHPEIDPDIPPQLGSPPNLFCVFEHESADTKEAFCSGTVKRAWRYDGTEMVPVLPAQGDERLRLERRTPVPLGQMYFRTGVFRFHISEDRKRIVFEYLVGPQYGRGYAYTVHRQGRTGTFGSDPARSCWIS